MTIQSITNTDFSQYMNTKNTGYMALGSLGLTAISASIAPLKKAHKPFAASTMAFSLIHLGTILGKSKPENKKLSINA